MHVVFALFSTCRFVRALRCFAFLSPCRTLRALRCYNAYPVFTDTHAFLFFVLVFLLLALPCCLCLTCYAASALRCYGAYTVSCVQTNTYLLPCSRHAALLVPCVLLFHHVSHRAALFVPYGAPVPTRCTQKHTHCFALLLAGRASRAVRATARKVWAQTRENFHSLSRRAALSVPCGAAVPTRCVHPRMFLLF